MQNQKPDPKKQPKVAMRIKWEHDVKNPENAEFVKEVADDLGKGMRNVTQDEFNRRYEIKKTNEYYDYDVQVPKKINIKLRSPVDVKFKNPFKSNAGPNTVERTKKEIKEAKKGM
jgi:hypothetical protein